jgi:hypothetical protein
MKKIYVAVAILGLSGCAYHKDGVSWVQSWNDTVGCDKEARKQETALESQCMAKLGYQTNQAVRVSPVK